MIEKNHTRDNKTGIQGQPGPQGPPGFNGTNGAQGPPGITFINNTNLYQVQGQTHFTNSFLTQLVLQYVMMEIL